MPLTLNNVSFAYRRGSVDPVPALDSVTLSVERGQLALVLGETGSGKSTLMRVAAGLLSPDSGSVNVDGERLVPGASGGRVGLVFQDPESQLFADTVLEDVAFAPRNAGASAADAAAIAAEALVAVGLDPSEFGGRSPFSLSGGEARRAAIAGVLAMRPAYLLADEPTAGLDSSGRSAVREVLLRQRETSGVVVVSHAAEQFLDISDIVVVMQAGLVSWSGPASSLVDDPSPLSKARLGMPDVLEVQYLARDKGLALGSFSLDVGSAAASILTASGGC